LLNGVAYDISKIEVYTHPGRDNFGEYFYMGKVLKGPGTRHFLMSRDLTMVEGEELPVLNIIFNHDLLDESKEKY
jgi:hypothetical protein